MPAKKSMAPTSIIRTSRGGGYDATTCPGIISPTEYTLLRRLW